VRPRRAGPGPGRVRARPGARVRRGPRPGRLLLRTAPLRLKRGSAVPVISAPHEFNTDDLFVDTRRIFGLPLYLKCEGFNFAGSIKRKAAVRMITAAEHVGRLTRDTVLVESSSGNLGVALAMIAASRRYRFTCVTDARCNAAT